MNKMAPLSTNQYEYLQRTFTSWFNVAEGGKRGGKNVINTLAFAINLEEHPDKIHLIAGVSVPAAKLNIIDCDGFGLANYFEGRCREGEYKRRDALFISTRTGEKIVLVSGLGKSRDETKIKGNTYGMVYITEVNECHIDSINECFDRTLTSKNRKIFHDLNPKAEGHFYYTDVLESHEKRQEKNPNYGYNYGHFTIADNMSLTQEKINKELATYDKKSVWFMRDILGKRKQAEGLVYPMFKRDVHVVPTEQRYYTKIYVSNDYGTAHPCVFQMWGLCDGVWYLIKEYYHNGAKNGQKTVDDYYADLLDFTKGYKISQYICDQAPVAASFNIHLRHKGDFACRDCNNEVLAGIQDVATALGQGLIKINDCCVNTRKEFELYSWRSNSVVDEVIKENDDTMDCLRYFVHTIGLVKPKWRSLLRR